VVNTGEIVFHCASQAMIAVVPRARLERANGWLLGGATLTQGILAGPLAGVLFAVAAGIPFLLNAATYAASALSIALVAGTYRARAGPAGQGLAEPATDRTDPASTRPAPTAGPTTPV
jgi:hypothetical protein